MTYGRRKKRALLAATPFLVRVNRSLAAPKATVLSVDLGWVRLYEAPTPESLRRVDRDALEWAFL